MKKQKTIKAEFLKTTVAIFGYSIAPVFLGVILLFVDINIWLNLGIAIAFMAVAMAFLFNGGTRFGKQAYKCVGIVRRKEENIKYAEFMAWKPAKSFLLCVPYICVMFVILLLSMLTGVLGGVFRIFTYIAYTPTALFARATAGINNDLQITWAGFVIFLVTMFIYVSVFCTGYIIIGLRLRKSDAEMTREIKSFNF